MLTLAPPSLQLSTDPWSCAFDLWLASRPSAHTRRAYRTAWELFHAFTSKHPADVGRLDVTAWVDHLRLQGLSPETIHQRLAALSSFYTFVTHTYTTVDPAGREQPLHTFNPALAVPHPKTAPYGKAHYLTADQARTFLLAIPRHTLQGQRDYALFLAYLLTGRRNSEIRLLRWLDFEFSSLSNDKTLAEGKVFYRWTGKGKHRRDECPLLLWQAIQSYLLAANRLKTIQPTDYLFTPLNHNASRLPSAHPPTSETTPQESSPSISIHPRSSAVQSPLSARSLDKLVKKYARLAALDPDHITVHTLRHTAAMLRKQAGDDLQSISAFLGHSTLAITQIYLHTVEGHADSSWLKVADLLGLPASASPLPDHQTRPPRRLPRRPRPTA